MEIYHVLFLIHVGNEVDSTVTCKLLLITGSAISRYRVRLTEAQYVSELLFKEQ